MGRLKGISAIAAPKPAKTDSPTTTATNTARTNIVETSPDGKDFGYRSLSSFGQFCINQRQASVVFTFVQSYGELHAEEFEVRQSTESHRPQAEKSPGILMTL